MIATKALAHDGARDAPAIAPSIELALTVTARMLEARDFDDPQAGAGGPNVDLRLDFEPVAIDVDDRKTVGPDGVVAVAEVGIRGSEQHVDGAVEHAIAEAAQQRDIGAASAAHETRPLGEI